MSNGPVKLKLPDGIPLLEMRASRMIRWFFIKEMERLRRARTAGAVYKPTLDHDMPDSGYCVWYQIYKTYAGEVNPLWGIREEIDHLIPLNRDVDPRKVLRKAHINEYREYGSRASNDCRIEAESAIYALVERLPVVKMSFGFTDDKTAMEMVRQQGALDPVIQLVFCVARSIPVESKLKGLAMARWAYCPHIYQGMPQSILEKYDLLNLFGVSDDFAAEQRVGIDGLLRSLGTSTA